MANTIWAIGRNYQDHAKEMQAETPQSPIVFTKAWACITTEKRVAIPAYIKELHHEIEVAVQLGAQLQPARVALALDFTARDIQAHLKKNGLPWALAKSFKNSCPMSPWVDFINDSWFANIHFDLAVNGNKRQKGHTRDMIFSLDKIIRYLDQHFPLKNGDIILTGTPAGVGLVKAGDVLEANLDSQIHWSLQIS